ncbi:hypothetical protein H5410_019039 [Solanum commersonii]|uniref:Uncharacterized protein n=1 Tax=Solanum commersonii TaxID=4109 RepID=A0A9J6A551_SOLCO|nr:hypothetical protein H5410_019039 [Solanum commersonii]
MPKFGPFHNFQQQQFHQPKPIWPNFLYANSIPNSSSPLPYDPAPGPPSFLFKDKTQKRTAARCLRTQAVRCLLLSSSARPSQFPVQAARVSILNGAR